MQTSQTARMNCCQALISYNSSIESPAVRFCQNCLQKMHGCKHCTQTACLSQQDISSFLQEFHDTPLSLQHTSFLYLPSAIFEIELSLKNALCFSEHTKSGSISDSSEICMTLVFVFFAFSAGFISPVVR